MSPPDTGMSPFMQVLVACMAIFAVCALIGVVWLAAVVGALSNRVDVLDDAATPSFTKEHEPVTRPAPVREPKTVEDPKQAAKVPPPQPVREFTGTDGKTHKFTFEGPP